MDFLKNLPWSTMFALKASGALLLAVIVVTILFNSVAPYLGGMQSGMDYAVSQASPPMMGGYGMGGGEADYGYAEDSVAANYAGKPMLSVRNAMSSMPYPQPGGTVGGDAEEFETTDYSVYIESRDRDDTCTGLAKLKELSYVVFENANEHDRGCNYTFKVEHARAKEILDGIVEHFSPKEVSESTYTIKRQVEDFTSQVEILEKKLASIDSTLETALKAYDDITALATRTNNAETLASVINSKLNIIERLTQERLNISAQLEQLSRAKAEQLDKLEYTYFHVTVTEKKFVDGEDIIDSWKNAVSATVHSVNRILQEATLGLVAFLFLLAQWILYILLLVVIGKYVWKTGKWIWNRE